MISLISKYSSQSHFVYKCYCRLIYPIFWLTLIFLLMLFVARPISDPDFWWHLKSGELMISQSGLLKIDPFNYPGDNVVGRFQTVILYGYWLWETIASVLYNSLGLNGILFFKFVTATLMSVVVLFEMSRQLLSRFTKFVLIGVSTLIVVDVYHLERPQIFSFIFMAILIGMISRISKGYTPSLLLFPLMFIWANMHRGFVVGDIALGMTATGFLIQYRHDNRKLQLYMTWAAVGILASFINPNGWTPIIELFNFMQNSIALSNENECRSTWELFLLQSKTSAISLWVISALHIAGLVLVSRRFWPEIFVSLFIIVFGLTFIRNSAFIVVSLLPMTGWYIEQAFPLLKRNIPNYVQAAICTVLVVGVFSATLGEWEKMKASQYHVCNSFPVKMAGFLKLSGLSGHLFNEFDTGGYLDWALHPQWKTFIDGREFDTNVSNQYLKIAAGSVELAEGKPYYETMLDRYQVDVVAMRIAYSDWRLQPLLKLLLNKQEWVPVYLDNQSFVLARYTPQNSAAVNRYGMEKCYFLNTLVQLIANYTNNSPDSVELSVLYADCLVYAGKLQSAENIIKKLETSNPDPEVMKRLRNSLRS